MYTTQELNTRAQGLNIDGEIPVITEHFIHGYTRINNEIDSAVESLTDSARRIRARRVTFRYEIHHTNEIVSIVLFAEAQAVTSRTFVMSVNFNPRNGAAMTLNQATTRNITPLVEGIIAEMIRQNPATYHAAFTADPRGQAFFVTRTSYVVLFDDFQLSSSPGATNRIVLNRSNIYVTTIRQSQYRFSDDRYAIKMIPLRTVLEGLGFDGSRDISWCTTQGAAVISRNGRVLITLRPGENNYQVVGVMQRSLESAPVMIDSNLYVPISFFDQILTLTTYSVDNQGNITFMSYRR